ncbi:MAG: NUDIX domain-containing protein [Candidatus Doudnabacteria bacterium]|nr:NUDIX domain-containing protein [Candidatus Doudnabacteria bacterium]
MKIGVDYIGVSTPFYCTDGQGRILLHRRSKNCRDENGKWDSGAGKLEFGLTPEENVLKEVLEEYGARGKIIGRVAPCSVLREFDGVVNHWLAIPFFIQINAEEAKNNEPEKIDELDWFTLDNMPSPLHSAFSFALKNFKDHFEKHIGKY